MANRQTTRNKRSSQTVAGAVASALFANVFAGHWEIARDSASRLLRTPATTLMTALVIAIALLLPGFLRQLEINLNPVADSF